MKKKRKREWSWLRYRKNDLAHNLQTAAQRWIHANCGTAVVMDGISIIEMPNEPPGNYYVAIGCLGIRPVKQTPAAQKAKRPQQ